MIDERLVLDANAVAGDFEELFGIDLTAVVHRCAHCGNVGPMATLLAFTHGPGTVLRCSVCIDVVVRYVRTPWGTRLDARGAAELRLKLPGEHDLRPTIRPEIPTPGSGAQWRNERGNEEASGQEAGGQEAGGQEAGGQEGGQEEVTARGLSQAPVANPASGALRHPEPNGGIRVSHHETKKPAAKKPAAKKPAAKKPAAKKK